MLLARIRVRLVFEGAERSDNAGAGVRRFNDRVNVAALGGDKGVGEAVSEFGDFFLAYYITLGVRDLGQLALVNNVHRAFGTHDGDFRRGPGEVGVGADAPP